MLLIRIGFHAMSDTVVAQARGNTGNVGTVPVFPMLEKGTVDANVIISRWLIHSPYFLCLFTGFLEFRHNNQR